LIGLSNYDANSLNFLMDYLKGVPDGDLLKPVLMQLEFNQKVNFNN